jgi:Siphovirus Gp157
MTALFALVADYRQAAETLADLDLDSQTVSDTLESLSGDVEHKAQQVAYVAMNFGTTAQAIRAHAAMQLARADAIENRAQALREYLARCMTDAGIEKIDGPGVKLSFRKSSAVQITGEDLIPAQYMRNKPAPPPAPDKAAIKAALAAGIDVPGASIEHRRSLVIA